MTMMCCMVLNLTLENKRVSHSFFAWVGCRMHTHVWYVRWVKKLYCTEVSRYPLKEIEGGKVKTIPFKLIPIYPFDRLIFLKYLD